MHVCFVVLHVFLALLPLLVLCGPAFRYEDSDMVQVTDVCVEKHPYSSSSYSIKSRQLDDFTKGSCLQVVFLLFGFLVRYRRASIRGKTDSCHESNLNIAGP